MIISVVNYSKRVKDLELQGVLRAVRRQLVEDFGPYWHREVGLRLEGTVGREADLENATEMRGDAVLYIQDEVGEDDALGYHDLNLRGIPYGFVYLDLCKQLGEEWSVTLSHEVLELAMDPEANLLAMGPHPADSSRMVYHWYELCDAVQDEKYQIDDVWVSNFVLPLYFTENNEPGSRNDFMGKHRGGRGVPSFGVAPGGYVGFFDPETGDHETFVAPDPRAMKRLKIKNQAGWARRGVRHQGELTSEVVRRLVTGCAAGQPLPGPWFEGFMVSIPARPRHTPKAELEAAAKKVLGTGWSKDWTIHESKLIPNKGPELDYELVPHKRVEVPKSRVWELYYDLRRELPTASVEPSFVYLTPDVDALAEQGASRRMSAARSVDLAESVEPEWCAKAIRLEGAWKKATGAGVRIAHPDTGWIRHPEIQSRDQGGPVRPDLGHDFVEDDDDAGADLDDDNLLPGGPNHGTATASVIASPRGSQTSSKTEYVVGVAPGAELVPLRVGNSVVHFSLRRVKKAIEYAIANGCHVVSMSLGGPFPSPALEKTLRLAAERGLVVVAAAGNNIPFHAVVFPARYADCIAVAASNAEDRPWSGSSRGSTVDITAPGESVWRALVEKDGTGRQKSTSERSSGTSYATAHVAGVCALWMEHHGYAALKQKFGGRLAEAFKYILRKTVQKDRPHLPEGDFVGLIDADAVLQYPLRDVSLAVRGRARARTPKSPDTLTPFRAILPHWDDAHLRNALQALLGVQERTLEGTLAWHGPEVAFQLATDQRLLRDFDAECQGMKRGRRSKRASSVGRDMESLRTRFRTISTSSDLRLALGGKKKRPLARGAEPRLERELRAAKEHIKGLEKQLGQKKGAHAGRVRAKSD